MPIMRGKFHGTMAATTPTGSRTVYVKASGRAGITRDLVAPACIVANRIYDRGHVLPPYRGERLARVQAFQLDEFFLMLFEQRCRALQDAAALGRPHSAPNLERRSGRGDGKVDVGLVALGHLGDGLFGGGIEVDGILAAARRNVLAVDEQFVVIKINSAIHETSSRLPP
jgi:hypothetical protein